jgi:hypothetical protein
MVDFGKLVEGLSNIRRRSSPGRPWKPSPWHPSVSCNTRYRSAPPSCPARQPEPERYSRTGARTGPRHAVFSSVSPYRKEPIRLKSLKFSQMKNALPTMFASGTNPRRGYPTVVAVVTHHEIVPGWHLADHTPLHCKCNFPGTESGRIGNEGRRIGIVQGAMFDVTQLFLKLLGIVQTLRVQVIPSFSGLGPAGR